MWAGLALLLTLLPGPAAAEITLAISEGGLDHIAAFGLKTAMDGVAKTSPIEVHSRPWK